MLVREDKNKIKNTPFFSSKKGINSGKVKWNNFTYKKFRHFPFDFTG
jgi:hypothetical protein